MLRVVLINDLIIDNIKNANHVAMTAIWFAFFWYPQRESNPQLALRRGLLYPFNYEGLDTSYCNIFRAVSQ